MSGVPWVWPPVNVDVDLDSSDIANVSNVPGATVTDALNTLAIRTPDEAAILASLAPTHWWNANHTVITGGLVDTMVDIGSAPKNFAQVGAARCAVGVDTSGQNYFDFLGAQYYRAGVAADWTPFSDGTVCTYALIISRTAAPTGAEAIVGTVSGDTTKNGFDYYWGFTSATDHGPQHLVCRSTLNQYVIYTESSFLGLSSGLADFLCLAIVRTNGATPPNRTSNGVTNQSIGATMDFNGHRRAWCQRNVTYNTGAAANPLTLGRRADLAAGQFLNARVYDVVLDSKCWSDSECQLWLQYARSRQGLGQQFGWPNVMLPVP